MGFQEFLELTLICQSNRTDSDFVNQTAERFGSTMEISTP